MSYGLLKGKKGIIFGALDSNSIAWKTAEKAHEEGAEFILTNAPVALRMGALNSLAEKTSSDIIPADATSIEDLKKLFDHTVEKFGKIDFILHSIGMSINVRKEKPYTDINYEWLTKGWDISAVSFHKIMKVAWDKEVMNEWGSIIALSYIAAEKIFPGYSDMADNKAYLQSIARSFGYEWGLNKKVRVNTISQSPTPTTAGQGIKGFSEFIEFSQNMSPLGNATAEDCANFCIAMFSNLTRKVTLQNIYHDGGFSGIGVSELVMKKFS